MFNQYPNYSRFILAKYSLDEVDSISFFFVLPVPVFLQPVVYKLLMTRNGLSSVDVPYCP